MSNQGEERQRWPENCPGQRANGTGWSALKDGHKESRRKLEDKGAEDRNGTSSRDNGSFGVEHTLSKGADSREGARQEFFRGWLSIDPGLSTIDPFTLVLHYRRTDFGGSGARGRGGKPRTLRDVPIALCEESDVLCAPIRKLVNLTE
uniref:Uncharacterized protein n=1 Tax=Vespula pensylvanica TaxID=30213 RepID=A0A834NYC4_VESPE|nr:hypothetical protein H0235_009210 [Vespula pensylvanica]